ncbi:MAG: NUDIX domain-containing protein [Chitinophagaceae bacterium]|nr:NUDIX domain-containing protein [Chitinophagaceae bacterium]
MKNENHSSISPVPRYAVGVLLRDGKILMGKRVKNRKQYPNAWSFFGGRCEGNETYYETLVRELQEELGIEVLQASSLHFFDQSPAILFEVFAVTQWQGEPMNKATEEHEVIQWFLLEEAKQLPVAAATYEIIFEKLMNHK